MKSKICLIIFTTLLAACSHVKSLQNFKTEQEYFDRINRECEGEGVKIEFVDTTFTFGKDFKINSDSSSWLDYNNKIHKIPTSKIESVMYNSKTGAIFRNLSIGTGIGIAAGSLLSAHDEHPTLGIFLTGITGAVIGTITGIINGEDRYFAINSSSKNNK